jgi:hypothetical protein
MARKGCYDGMVGMDGLCGEDVSGRMVWWKVV